MEYGLADIAAPFIQFKGTLGACYRESKGMALCGIYRQTSTGWKAVAIRYFDKFTPASKIRTVRP